MVPRHSMEVYETYTPLNQKMSVILNKMKKRVWALPLPLQKNDAPMGSDHDQYCLYVRCKRHNMDTCKILKRDIKVLIQNELLKIFVAKRDCNPSPSQKDTQMSPERKGGTMTSSKEGNPQCDQQWISLGGETSSAQEVYASQVSDTTIMGKHPRTEDEIVISFFESETEHVTCPHDDALVITIKIDGHDVKRLMLEFGSSMDVLFLTP